MKREASLNDPVTAAAELNLFPPGALGLQDILAGMAKRVPGGFGGFYYDEDGRLTTLLTDASRQHEARTALNQEPFVQRRQAGATDFDLEAARVEVRPFDYATLDAWFRLLMNELDVVLVSSSIDVRENRISIGAIDEADLRKVQGAIADVGVPDGAIFARVMQPPVRARGAVQQQGYLTDKHRPVPGGVQIEADVGFCTIGPNVRWHADPEDIQDTFLITSHCHGDAYDQHYNDPPGADIYQEEDRGGIQRPIYFIGSVVWDPELETQGCANPYGCRNSDAALAIYAAPSYSEFGEIARPSARNPATGHEIIDNDDPRFEIVAREAWTFQGETLEKVGLVTGWSGGEVWEGCEHIAPANGPTIYCSMKVEGSSLPGDSGGPIFRVLSPDPETGLEVEIRGTLWGGSQSPTEPFYCDGQAPPRCFFGSNLGGIEMDLDPNWQSGLFQYWPGGEIW